MKAVNLKVEYLTNPIGIDILNPCISWNCFGGETQSAYQIVARNDEGDEVWNSGKVDSSQMHLIPWGGSKLRSRDVIYYNVSLWDESGVCEISDEAYFEIGLVAEEDWQANWITGNYKVEKNTRYPVDCFRKCFEVSVDKKIKKARAYMTACGVYEGCLNGEKIGTFVLAPGITDYRKRVQYQTVDVTNLIKPGMNELRFMLADGWYRGSVGAWAMKNYYGKETKLLAQLEVVYEDGTVDNVCTDDTFEWTNEGPIRFADNKDGEIYDAKKEAFAGVVWSGAKVTSHNVVPTASNNFLLVEQEKLCSPELIVTPSGKTVLDFRQNIAGIVRFSCEAKAGQRIFMRFGELIKDGEFTQKNIQCVNKKIVTPLQQVEYFCKDGFNEYKTRFAIFGYQYIQIELFDVDGSAIRITKEVLKNMKVEAIAVYSDFETTFRFDSSNDLLNKFVDNTLWSLKNNSADLPTDCPTRERHGWTGDAQIFFNTASYMVNYAPFAMKFENDMCDWQDKKGRFPQIAPEGGTDPYMRTMNGSVGWADAGIMIPYRLWKKYGDRRVIEKYYGNMKKYAKFMIARTKKITPFISERTGLSRKDRKYIYNCGQHYGEWAEPSDIHKMSWKDFMTSQPEVATAYLSYVMSLMVEIADTLEKYEDKILYEEYKNGAKKSYQKLVEQKKYSLNTNRQAKLVRPLYFDLLNDTQTAFAKKRLVQALEEYGWRIGTGFLSTPFILYVLSDIDIELAYKLLENEDAPGWLCMPKAGATTIWEDWDGPNSDNGKGGGIASLNHYSKGAVCEWIFERMCGIKIAGENEFSIEPYPGGHFSYAKVSYDSIYGRIGCEWRKRDDLSYLYIFTIPSNTKAKVKFPDQEELCLSAGEYQFVR